MAISTFRVFCKLSKNYGKTRQYSDYFQNAPAVKPLKPAQHTATQEAAQNESGKTAGAAFPGTPLPDRRDFATNA